MSVMVGSFPGVLELEQKDGELWSGHCTFPTKEALRIDRISLTGDGPNGGLVRGTGEDEVGSFKITESITKSINGKQDVTMHVKYEDGNVETLTGTKEGRKITGSCGFDKARYPFKMTDQKVTKKVWNGYTKAQYETLYWTLEAHI